MPAQRKRKTDESNFRGDTPLTDEEIDTAAKEVERKNAEFKRSSHYSVSKQGTKEIPSMSKIDPTEWQLDDAYEPFALKDGSEVVLRIIDVRFDVRPDGTQYYTVRFEVPSEPYSKDITDWLNTPDKHLDAKRFNAAQIKMRHFMDCFRIDRTCPSDPLEDWVGQEGWCLLGLSKSDQYGEQNRISKFIVPR